MGTEYKQFTEAMAIVQKTLGGAVKDSVNPHFRSKYADLTSVWDAWQQVGPSNGFSVIQIPQDAGDRVGILLETTIHHTGGHNIVGRFFMPAAKNDAQAYGSALTYARRYALASMVGICPEDDDGNAAVKKQEADANITNQLLAAYNKFSNDIPKLELILTEAKNYNMEQLRLRIESRIKDLKSPT